MHPHHRRIRLSPVLRLDGLTATSDQVREITEIIARAAQGIPPAPPIR